MKPLFPHDPLDDLIAAALHGELTPEERMQFETRLSTDPAAQAAYQEAQAMHDLLEKTHKTAQPDPAFEQRMVSGVRRKIQHEENRETAWESLLALWSGIKKFFPRKRQPMPWLGSALVVIMIVAVLAGVALGPITRGIKQTPESRRLMLARQQELAAQETAIDRAQAKSVFSTITNQLSDAKAKSSGRFMEGVTPLLPANSQAARLAQLDKIESHYRDELRTSPNNQIAAKHLERIEDQKRQLSGTGSIALGGANTYSGGMTMTAGKMVVSNGATLSYNEPTTKTTPQGGTIRGSGFIPPMDAPTSSATPAAPSVITQSGYAKSTGDYIEAGNDSSDLKEQEMKHSVVSRTDTTLKLAAAEKAKSEDASNAAAALAASAPDTRKLIRNAQLDLEVKSFQSAMDQITALTKAAGGYVDTSNSQKGGNGKLQGTVVVKVLPENLDDFLLKLRDLGVVKNQSVSTDDVTKDYFDTQARLDNSRRMEAQLQDLLKHANSKVSDLLQVERELGRVRGEIEQMQGQLKLYDFQVQYATVTMQMREKDLNQAAAYLLKEQDQFSLFATDVEGTFQKARQTADDFKAQVLTADLNHNSGSDVSAELVVMVAPDQIEPFLAQVRSLGRVANFTRQTQRVANDGGDSDQPADQALTEKDKVQVRLAIRSDDETRKQVALTVVAKAVDEALDQAKTAALASAGVEILNSSLNKTPQGQSTAQLTVRVPGKDYSTVIDAFRALGRTASLSIQRNDNSGPGANGDDAPVIVSLALTDDDTPLQETEMSVLASDVDAQSQQIKKDAAASGVEVKASSFERQPDGTELAQMTFRLPMSKYSAFVESVKKLGKVESLSVRRDDRPDQTRTDETAPAEISLQLHNQRDIVADNGGLWATLRQTFGEGAAALFGSVRVIGVVIAFLAPWVVTLVLLAWVGRRIYIWRKK